MSSLIIFALLATSSWAFPQVYIVNGTDAVEGEFPSAVSLRNQLRHTCGGTILNDRYVLTAAHCVCDDDIPRNASLYSIQYGSVLISADEERSVNVQEIICGPFDLGRLDYDVAVLRLVTTIPNDGTWEPVKLAKRFDTARPHHGVIVGWGRLYANGPIPDTLQKLEVTTITNTVCGMRFDNHHHLCFMADVGGACNGDSGTSLIVDGEQVGIASFITATCGTTSLWTPNVYARVTSYYDWIEDNSKL